MGVLANALKRFGRPGYQTPASQKRMSQSGMLVAPATEAEKEEQRAQGDGPDDGRAD